MINPRRPLPYRGVCGNLNNQSPAPVDLLTKDFLADVDHALIQKYDDVDI
jgi:hypothetical protein